MHLLNKIIKCTLLVLMPKSYFATLSSTNTRKKVGVENKFVLIPLFLSQNTKNWVLNSVKLKGRALCRNINRAFSDFTNDVCLYVPFPFLAVPHFETTSLFPLKICKYSATHFLLSVQIGPNWLIVVNRMHKKWNLSDYCCNE